MRRWSKIGTKKIQRELLSQIKQVKDALSTDHKRDSGLTLIIGDTKLEITILPQKPYARKATRTALMMDEFRKFLHLLRDLGFKPSVTAHRVNRFFAAERFSNVKIDFIGN